MVTRRQALAHGLALGASFALVPRALRAERVQVAGIYRRTVGDMVVTALLDGWLALDTALLAGADTETVGRLLTEAFVANPVETPINAYAIERGERLMLVDGGAAGAFGPTAGGLSANLALAGIDPARVDTLFCTHLHPDHVGAFTTAEGTAAFPKARLVVHEADPAYWTDDANFAAADDMTKNFVAIARAALAAYADRTERVADGAEVFPGATLMHLPGHTPGHAGLMLADGAQTMLLWADIVHFAAVQFAQPKATVAFDVDQTLAAASRARALDMVATDRVEIGGSHIGFPSFGHVTKAAEGYRFTPSPWDYAL